MRKDLIAAGVGGVVTGIFLMVLSTTLPPAFPFISQGLTASGALVLLASLAVAAYGAVAKPKPLAPQPPKAVEEKPRSRSPLSGIKSGAFTVVAGLAAGKLLHILASEISTSKLLNSIGDWVLFVSAMIGALLIAFGVAEEIFRRKMGT